VPTTKCGFDDGVHGSGADLLASLGPTVLVDIGFDPSYRPPPATNRPTPGIQVIHALVDTGAGECCIDSLLAAQLQLPVVDRRKVSGVHGAQEVNMHLAQVFVPSLGWTMYGAFAGVHLAAGGQVHQALIGRSFLRHFTMSYEGRTGTVTLSND